MPGMMFNCPPGWPAQEPGWLPGPGWKPDPSWPPAPAGWKFIVAGTPTPVTPAESVPTSELEVPAPPGAPAPHSGTSLPATAVTDATRLQAELEDVRAQLVAERRRATELAQRLAENEAGRDVAGISEDIRAARAELVELNDAVLLQSVGIYHYHHPLENADAFKERLAEIKEQIKDAVREGTAIEASDRFAYNNSLAQGRKMTADFSKLMLRTFNAEADNCVRSLRAGSIQAARKRIQASAETIARLGSMMEMRVSVSYQALRVAELELTSDYLFKVQEEREAAREERERIREERRAEQELAAERERLDRERAHYVNALNSVRSTGTAEEVAELEAQVARLDGAIEANDFRAANIRAGYVYVISNVGAFGTDVVKIGMTRRLDPMDRVRELGDASVPFPFDVHAIYFSEDAITLENELHKAFAARRLNQVNLRREFFFATPAQVRDVLAEKLGNLLEFTNEPTAEQYFQSRGLWPSEAS